MIDQLGVSPRPNVMGGGGICSLPQSYRGLIYVITGNGNTYNNKPANPAAPALVCLNKDTGRVIWKDSSSGTNILFGEWGSPLVIEINGRGQVIAPQGDGWVRSFDALTGELIWKFDINPKDRKWLQTKGFFSTSPVYFRDRIYVATGNYIEFGELPGRLGCLDPTKTGDISLELDDGPGKGRPNPNSGAVWHLDGIRRMMSMIAIQNGLLIAPDFAGFVHCLDADTGKKLWIHDTKGHIVGSPLIVDGKVYVSNEDGDMCVFALSMEKTLLFSHNFAAPIFSSPVFANGVLYLALDGELFAIQQGASSPPPKKLSP